jgi:L-asparaginase
MAQHRLLILYTGGTIGMVQAPGDASLIPFDFSNLIGQLPEITRFRCSIDYHSFSPLLDSSDMDPQNWIQIAKVIGERYQDYDSFIVLHGSDTMAFTASALSFMLEGLGKPVILTGAQLPIGEIRTDAKENLITSIEIASTAPDSLKEVCIYFDYQLMRGNRTHKKSVQRFEAFTSSNYPLLAEARTSIQYYPQNFLKQADRDFRVQEEISSSIGLLKFFPGMPQALFAALLRTPGLKGLVLESFGAGNLPVRPWLFDLLEEAQANGIVILNITQCEEGTVEMGKYETSRHLAGLGIVSGRDMTTEAAIAKLGWLCGKYEDAGQIRQLAGENLRGEMTV